MDSGCLQQLHGALISWYWLKKDRYSSESDCKSAPYLVVLGGGLSSLATDPSQWEFMKPATFSRVSAAARYARQSPNTTVILTGGAVYQVSEGRVMADYIKALGIAANKVWLEEKSYRQGLHDVPALALMPQTTTLVEFDLWLHEKLALLVYRFKGCV